MFVPFHIYLYGVNRSAIDNTFENLATELPQLPRLYFEPDGSFVWTGETTSNQWQLDGMIYDAAHKIQYLDLKGWCPWQDWMTLLKIVAGEAGYTPTWTVLQLPEQLPLRLSEFHSATWPGSQTI